LVSPGYQPLAGRAKDAAAGAVLLAAIGAAVIGGIIFLPKIIAVLLRFFG
jgi:diacylglycerol kinase